MIDIKSAMAHVIEHANQAFGYPRDGEYIIVLEQLTVDKPYGWYFVYNTTAALRNDFMGMLIGNGPILVFRDGSGLREFASAYSLKQAVELHESEN